MSDKNYQNFEKSEILPIVNISKKVYTLEFHTHAVYEILYIKEGTVSLQIDNKKYKIQKGCVFFIEPLEQHKLTSMTNKEFEYCSMVFDKSVFGDSNNPCRYFFDSIKIKRFLQLPERILSNLSNICDNDHSFIPGYEILQYSLLFDIYSHLVRTNQYDLVSIIRRQTKYSISAVQIAIDYIQEHYTEFINLTDILELTNYSKSHFIKLFKDNTGMNLTEYINKYRIDRACLELQFTDKNITEIATQTGFNNIQYFSRVFKEYMNCTPKQYQLKIKRIK